LAGSVAVDGVSSATGRVLAWQSMHEAGCACAAAVSEAWYRTGAPPSPLAQVAPAASVGLVWQRVQSCGTSLSPLGTPLVQATASCRISPVAGVRAGLSAVGPTKPRGCDEVWQLLQPLGAGRVRLASDEWSSAG